MNKRWSLVCLIFLLNMVSDAMAIDLSQQRLEFQLPVFGPNVLIPANSEWINPVILKSQNNHVLLPQGLQRDLPKYLQSFKKVAQLRPGEYLLELYPVRGDGDRWQWYISRFKIQDGKNNPWQWSSNVQIINPWTSAEEWKKIFGPQQEMGLYDKPFYPQCAFARKESPMDILRLWDIKTDYQEIFREGVRLQNDWNNLRPICLLLNAPPVIDGSYRTLQLLLTVRSKRPVTWHWHDKIDYSAMLKNIDVTIQADSINQQWEKNWTTEYLKQLKICSGESDALMPDGKRVKFVRKNNLQADHQLQLMSDYLEDYYRQLGLKTWRQKFTWQGIPQENLIAQIGSDELPQTPVIFLDHYDTAFSEDVWAKNKVRQSNPGADDNCSATAGLMVAAKQLISSQSKLKRPIWIIHVTGEEFPADDLGARQFVSMLLNEKISPHAVIVMDMIAYAQKKADRKIFQISIGDGKQAALIGAIGNQVSHLFYKSVSHNSKSVVRYRFDDRSFLHQTDAIIFSDYGFPVVLFNEHLNQKDNWERAHYHQSSDLSYTLNIDYAAEILQTATETVRVLGLEAYLQQ